MHISQNCLALIKTFESLRTVAYQDQAGIWTIGYGTTHIKGVPVRAGQTCTEGEALTWMQDDLTPTVTGVQNLLSGITLAQNQFDALVDFAYNAGLGALQQSTLRRNIRMRVPVVENNFTAWNKLHQNGVLVESNGLTRRRKSEYTLYSANKLQFQF